MKANAVLTPHHRTLLPQFVILRQQTVIAVACHNIGGEDVGDNLAVYLSRKPHASALVY
jgi:hypothetical protein